MAAHQRACCGESDLARLGSSGGDGPGVDISNRRSQLPINASVASSQLASSLPRGSSSSLSNLATAHNCCLLIAFACD